MSEEVKKEAVQKKTAKKEMTYGKNIENRFEINGVEITDGFVPDEKQKSDTEFMQKLNHAVKCGALWHS